MLIGTRATTEQSNFDTAHPLYRLIAALAKARRETPALTGGDSVTRAFSNKPGLFAVSRFDPATGREVLLLFNTSTQQVAGRVQVDTASGAWRGLVGACPAQTVAPGSASYVLPPLGYAICVAQPE